MASLKAPVMCVGIYICRMNQCTEKILSPSKFNIKLIYRLLFLKQNVIVTFIVFVVVIFSSTRSLEKTPFRGYLLFQSLCERYHILYRL